LNFCDWKVIWRQKTILCRCHTLYRRRPPNSLPKATGIGSMPTLSNYRLKRV
jgi:hypothetical protein